MLMVRNPTHASNSGTTPLPFGPSVANQVQRFTIGDGDLGTAQTIDKVRKLIHDGMTDQMVNRLAIQIIQQAGVQQFDFVGEIRAIYSWVLHNFRFVRDTFGIETLRTVREILQVRAGDCDDINAILLPSLLGTIGAHVRLVTVSADPQDPATFSHIYCEVELPSGQWLPIDAARRNPAFGRGPNFYYRKRVWDILDNRHQDVGKLSGYFRAGVGMGDDTTGTTDTTDSSFNWLGLANVISSAATGAASIIKATTIPTIAPAGYTVNPTTGQLVPLTPQGTLVASSAPGGVVVSSAGSIPNWMFFAALGLGAVLLLRH